MRRFVLATSSVRMCLRLPVRRPRQNELVEISVDGERKALLDIDPKMYEGSTSLIMKTPGVQVSAGAHRVTAAFMQRFEGPVNDVIAPVDHTLADTQIGVAFGITTLPHLKDLAIAGPQHAVKYLIEELGTSPNARDADGHTAQHHAASRGDDEMIKYLVSKGADVTMLNRGGQATVDMANRPVLRVQPFPETSKLLESLSAKNNRKCASRWPPGPSAYGGTTRSPARSYGRPPWPSLRRGSGSSLESRCGRARCDTSPT